MEKGARERGREILEKARKQIQDFVEGRGFEERVKKVMTDARTTFEKNVKEATKRLGIPSRDDLRKLEAKIETLAKRLDKLGKRATRKAGGRRKKVSPKAAEE